MLSRGGVQTYPSPVWEARVGYLPPPSGWGTDLPRTLFPSALRVYVNEDGDASGGRRDLKGALRLKVVTRQVQGQGEGRAESGAEREREAQR